MPEPDPNQQQQQQQQQPPTWKATTIFADDAGTFAPDWHKSLPPDFDDVRGIFDGAKSLKDIGARMKGLRDSQAQAGPSIRIPGEKATDEEKSAFVKDLHKHLGVPEGDKAADAYDLTPPEGMEADEELVGWMKSNAPALGIPPAAAKKLADGYNELMQKRVEAHRAEITKQQETERQELATEFGSNADAAVALAKEAAKRHGWPEESMDPTNEGFVGKEAFKLVHSLAVELAKATGSDRTAHGNPAPGSGVRDAAWAKRVQQGHEPESAFINDRTHPKYAETWAAIEAAYKASHPGKK